MDDIQRLIAVEEIKRLKSRYFRALDKKDWDAFAANFTDDIIFDFTESDTGQDVDELVQQVYRVEGAKEAAAWARDALGDAVTSHHGHMPDIDVLDDESAIGTWSLNDQIWFPPGSEFRFSKLEGYGHYEETYKRVDGAWKVASAKFIRHHAVWTVRGDD